MAAASMVVMISPVPFLITSLTPDPEHIARALCALDALFDLKYTIISKVHRSAQMCTYGDSN